MKVEIKEDDGSISKLKLIRTKYQDGSPALVLEEENGTPYAKLSINVPEAKDILKPGQYIIKDYSENSSVVDQLIDQGVLVMVREPDGYGASRPLVFQVGHAQVAAYYVVVPLDDEG